MNTLIRSIRQSPFVRILGTALPRPRVFLLVVAGVASAVLSPIARGQCPDGCNGTNTYQGANALQFATGGDNAAFGYDALFDDETGYSNTAVGALALISNSSGYENTGVGVNVLNIAINGYEDTGIGANAFGNGGGNYNTASGAYSLFNTSGSYNVANGYSTMYYNTSGYFNTAVGYTALYRNTTGFDNTAVGSSALLDNTTASYCTAVGESSLLNNTTGVANTGLGRGTLTSNTTGANNTAEGAGALYTNTTGSFNTCEGVGALYYNQTGSNNTAMGGNVMNNTTTGGNNSGVGYNALLALTTGGSNIALGYSAGANLTTGSNNIDIGNAGVAAEAKTIRVGASGTQTATYIAGIRGVPLSGAQNVVVNASGQLGVKASSARFKENIETMGDQSEAILALRPVSFRYKKAIDPRAAPQFGLIAEEVAKVDRDLIVTDDKGKPFSVRYEEVNAMLLNEFLKDHRKGEQQARKQLELEATVAQQQTANTEQQKEIKALAAALKEQAAQIQKVSEQVTLSPTRTRLVANGE